MFIRSELEDQIRDVSKSLASAEAVIESISELFPDNACHKHPETGVSLLEDVSDVITKYNDLGGEIYNLHIQLNAATARAEAAERERDEARVHAADLRWALEWIQKVDENGESRRWPEIDECIRTVTARTPAQSLLRVKAEALREWVKVLRDEVHDKNPSEYADRGLIASGYVEALDDTADLMESAALKLEKEATNGTN